MLGGLDIGTTGCKIVVYDNDGTFCCRFYRKYPVTRSQRGHEISADVVWKAVKEILRDAACRCPDIAAIGITGFGEAFACLDERDRPLFPIMLNTDARGTEECCELVSVLGKEALERITGLVPHGMYSISKILWIKKHRPEIYGKIRRILTMQDYIVYMLTGNAVIDYSQASRTMCFDIQKLRWSGEILCASGVEEKLFAVPVPAGTAAGTVRAGLTEELGFRNAVLILPAGHDQVAASVGAGVFETGSATDGCGTVQCMTPVYEGIPEGDAMIRGHYAVVPYVFPGKYVTYAFSYTGGALISWFVSQMAKGEEEAARKQGISVYELLEQGMKDEPTGILVLPHFAGAATPYMDQTSKGAITGLTLEHTTSDLYRAVLEGITYEMKLNMEYLRDAGICPRKLHATGGGAASRAWLQMKADILECPIISVGNYEAGAVGCVMMAGIAKGLFSNLKEAAEIMVAEREKYEPRPEKQEAYRKQYDRYRNLYQGLRSFGLI